MARLTSIPVIALVVLIGMGCASSSETDSSIQKSTETYGEGGSGSGSDIPIYRDIPIHGDDSGGISPDTPIHEEGDRDLSPDTPISSTYGEGGSGSGSPEQRGSGRRIPGATWI